jgi:hypothetical protein
LGPFEIKTGKKKAGQKSEKDEDGVLHGKGV